MNDFWMTLAQPLLGADPVAVLTGETFVTVGVAPVPWPLDPVGLAVPVNFSP